MASSPRRARALGGFLVALTLVATPSWGGVELGTLPEPGPAPEPPVGDAPCSGVRPGARAATDLGSLTLGFLYEGSDGRRYLATAGHAILRSLGVEETSWEPGMGPPVRNIDGRIGEFAYGIDRSVGEYRRLDFALIRLDKSTEARARMCHWGGPTGAHTEVLPPTSPLILRFFGSDVSAHAGGSVGVSAGVRARSAVAFGTSDPYWVVAWGISIGESGAPVMTEEGLALGIARGSGGGADPFTGQSGTMFITRLDVGLEHASTALGITFKLRTARLAS